MTWGQEIAEWRKNANYSQAELAHELEISQSSVSRLESMDVCPDDFRLLSKLARALHRELTEIIPDYLQESILPRNDSNVFYAFCDNPFCDSNEHLIRDGRPYVNWKSSKSFPSELFQYKNFCPRCGNDLIKECPNCKRRLEERFTRFCGACGAKMTDHPTEDEWARIASLHASSQQNETSQPELGESGEIPF